MLSLLLASSLIASIPQAIDRTNTTLCQGYSDDKLIECLLQVATKHEKRFEDDERIAVNTWKCFNGALIGGATDLGFTALALKDHPTEVKEANPLGFSVESRIALKMAQVGATGWGCYLLEKGGHDKMADIVSKTSFYSQLAFATNNLVRTLILNKKSRK